MEDEDRLLGGVSTDRGFGLQHAKQHGFYLICGIDIDGAWNVSTVILIIKPTIDDVEVMDLRLEVTIQ